MLASSAPPVRVLVVEPRDEVFDAFTAALDGHGVPAAVERCGNAAEAAERLAGAAPDARPALILLDLDLPGGGALDLLRRLKAADRLGAIPVVAIGAPRDEAAVRDVYRAGASSLVRRPEGADTLRAVADRLVRYWFSVAAALPPGAEA